MENDSVKEGGRSVGWDSHVWIGGRLVCMFADLHVVVISAIHKTNCSDGD